MATEKGKEKARSSIHLGNLLAATKAGEVNPVVVSHPKWLTWLEKIQTFTAAPRTNPPWRCFSLT
jgi:hypothetical protein